MLEFDQHMEKQKPVDAKNWQSHERHDRFVQDPKTPRRGGGGSRWGITEVPGGQIIGPAFSSRSVGWALVHVRRLGGRFGKPGEGWGDADPACSKRCGTGCQPGDSTCHMVFYISYSSPGLGLAIYTIYSKVGLGIYLFIYTYLSKLPLTCLPIFTK